MKTQDGSTTGPYWVGKAVAAFHHPDLVGIHHSAGSFQTILRSCSVVVVPGNSDSCLVAAVKVLCSSGPC